MKIVCCQRTLPEYYHGGLVYSMVEYRIRYKACNNLPPLSLAPVIICKLMIHPGTALMVMPNLQSTGDAVGLECP